MNPDFSGTFDVLGEIVNKDALGGLDRKMIQRHSENRWIRFSNAGFIREPQPFKMGQVGIFGQDVRDMDGTGVRDEPQCVVGLEPANDLYHVGIFIKDFIKDRNEIFESEAVEASRLGHVREIFEWRHLSGFKLTGQSVIPEDTE